MPSIVNLLLPIHCSVNTDDINTSSQPTWPPISALSNLSIGFAKTTELATEDLDTINESETLAIFRFTVNACLLLTGVPMNIICMEVFFRQGLSDRINLCLFSLAISDTGYLIFYNIFQLATLIGYINPLAGQYWTVRSMNFVGVFMAFFDMSNFVTMLISLERCFMILYPLKARAVLSVRHMAVLIVAMSVICLVGCGLLVFKFDTATFVDKDTNVARYVSVFTPFYLAHGKLIDLSFFIFNIIFPIGAIIIVSLATLIIAVHMHTVSAWRQKNASVAQATSQVSVTRMLIVVCLLFIVCSAPNLMRSFWDLLPEKFEHLNHIPNSTFVKLSLTHVTVSVNCSVNFIIYLIMSTRFRQTLMGMLRGKKPVKDDREALARQSA